MRNWKMLSWPAPWKKVATCFSRVQKQIELGGQMKRSIFHALIVLSVLNTPLTAWADPPADVNAPAAPREANEPIASPGGEALPPPPSGPRERRNSVTFTYGTYILAHSAQNWSLIGPYSCSTFLFFTICGNSMTPQENRFDTFAHDVGGLEYERKLGRHFAYGATWFHAKTTFTTPSLTPATGVARADFLMATITLYMRQPGSVRPFIGVGYGDIWGRLSGGVNQDISGAASMARIGLRYETERANYVLGYRDVRTSLIYNRGAEVGSISGTTNLSGRGIYVGAGVRF